MQPRFVGRLGLADAVTVSNAALGFLAAVAATVEPGLAAQLILLAAVADGLDGVVARKLGGTPAGEYLDSLADVASFGVAPAVLVFVIAREQWGVADPTLATAAAFCVPALFVAMAVVRLGLYTAYDVGNHHTEGVQSTLAATLLAAAVLAGVEDAAILLGATGLFAYLMVTCVSYPDLYARDAVAMGGLQTLAILAPAAFGRAFPRLLLAAALAYLLLAPRFYWRETDAGDTPESAGRVERADVEGKRS
ncbi:protein sorting system archaetidylserine synthase [Halorussus amylolyticus]|uniref:protein sorting system archaetidylserine synthase n=1 Tax=Halorussus amylolyticus TaxID=1126242 RepID=UPI0010528EC0|nr:protein sorting system archaetidylserine synthase [Halorussus amylolyticus]